MYKIIIIYFLQLILLVSSIKAEKQYYVMHEGQKQFLYPEQSKIIVKFKSSNSDYLYRSSIENLFGNNIRTYNKFKEYWVIIELNNDADENHLDKVRNINNVEYVSYGFTNGDKVIHYPTNEIIVKYRSSYNRFDQMNLNNLFKAEEKEQINSFDNMFLLSVNSNGSVNTDNVFEIANKFVATGMVEFAQPDFVRTNMLLYMPNDSLADSMWHVKNTGTNIPQNVQGIPGADLNLDSAWNITIGNPNVLIAIIDTGCDTGHVDLKPNFCAKNLWYDAYDNDGIPMDEYSHGTPMAGIADAAGNNGIGTVGVAFGCKFMPVRVFGPWPLAYTTDLILGKGLQWAWQHGASVLSNSWGGGIPTPVITNAILNAKRYGRNTKGCVVVAGSGNENDDTVYYPASYPGVIGVGGVTPCNQRKDTNSCDHENWGANYGEGLGVVAPIPFIGAPLVLGGWCICASGTSSATPQVSGIAALLISKNVNISGDSVKMAIEKTAQRVGNYNYNINKENGSWNFEMGYGRPDAKKALDFIPQGPSQIYDLVPPIISLIPPESNLFNGTLTIDAEITDNQGVANGNNSPRLYYTKTLNPTTGIITANFISGKYRFILPELARGERMYYYTAAQDTSVVPNTVTYPFGGKGFDPPGMIGPNKKLFLTNSSAYSQTFSSSNPVIIIPQTTETTIVANLNCPVNKTILDVNCKINITHEYLEDLVVSLISPVGTDIILTASMGKNGDNYANTVFDDEASMDILDTNNLPPYTGNFKPLEKLWLFDGENSGGTWKLVVVDNLVPNGGSLNDWSLSFKFADINEISSLPDRFALIGNFPNPFNPVTSIKFNVKQKANIKIILYNIIGEQVATILNEIRDAGFNSEVQFNATTTNDGNGIASGVYFYSMFADGSYVDSRKMVLVK